jgi:hypothetical protein
MRNTVVIRIEALAAALAAREQQDSGADVTTRIKARLEAYQREEAQYEAMSTEEKLVAKEQQLGELPADAFLSEYRRRELELTILELRGASPELLKVARDQATAAVRFCRPMPPIPSHAEAVAIIEAQKPPRAPTEASAPSPRQRRADVVELDDYRKRDVLADYRGRQQPQLEPPVV